MSERYDAIIIGAGIIGSAIALELARAGWKTVNVDRLPAAGYGSTGSSCAIIRTHYSTVDGAALAYEGYFYWKQWAEYLATRDERGLARFVDCGCMVMKTEKNGYLATICANMNQLGIPYEEWDPPHIQAKFPIYDLHRFGPVRRPDDSAFGDTDGESLAVQCFSRPRAISATLSLRPTTSSAPRRRPGRSFASMPRFVRSGARAVGRQASPWWTVV